MYCQRYIVTDSVSISRHTENADIQEEDTGGGGFNRSYPFPK